LIVLGSVVAVPVATFFVMQIVNATVFECSNGGAEDSLSCVLRTLAVTVLSIPFGAVAGFFAAMWVGKSE
jgi:ABC-type sulfate transport system permease subunit